MMDVMEAAEQFAARWTTDVHTLVDNANHFTVGEVSALADLLTACGKGDNADILLNAWIEGEIEDGEANAGDWSVVDHGLVHNSDEYN